MRTRNIGKVAVFDPAGNVLLLRRSKTDPRRPGEWDFPGGAIEPGEDAAEGVCRELHEEANITAAPGELALIYTATEFYAAKQESNNRLLYFLRISNQAVASIALSDEHDEFVWVPVAQALQDFPHPFYGAGLQYALDHDLLK